MTFAAWNVISAPKVLSRTPNDHSQPITLQHLSTHIISVSKAGCAVGNAVWGAVIDCQEIYVAFDWQEMRQGVAVLNDPNGIISNLSFVNDDGDEEPLLRQIVGLARLLHSTPWQALAVSEAEKQRTTRADQRTSRAEQRSARADQFIARAEHHTRSPAPAKAKPAPTNISVRPGHMLRAA